MIDLVEKQKKLSEISKYLEQIKVDVDKYNLIIEFSSDNEEKETLSVPMNIDFAIQLLANFLNQSDSLVNAFCSKRMENGNEIKVEFIIRKNSKLILEELISKITEEVTIHKFFNL